MLQSAYGPVFRSSVIGGAAIIAAALALASPVNAQTLDRQQDLCADEDASGDERVAACTAIIESGKLDPKLLAAAYMHRADAYQGNQDLEHALADGDAAIRLDPNSALAFFRRADIYKNMDQPDLAIRDFTEAIRLDSTNPVFFIDRSNSYLDKHDYDRAIADLNEALRMDPADEREAIINRCYALAVKGDFDSALADCQKGLQQHPNDTYGLGRLGFLYSKMGKYDDSISNYTAALAFPDLEPYEKAFPLYGRGLVKLKLGDKSGETDIAEAKTLWKNVTRDFE